MSDSFFDIKLVYSYLCSKNARYEEIIVLLVGCL